MRDIIWTVIVIWLIYKIVEIFRNSGAKKSGSFSRSQSQNSSATASGSIKKDIKSAVHKSADKEGDYVDFEEVK